MKTQCNPSQLEFHALGKGGVVSKFDGGNITPDGGSLLLRESEKRTRDRQWTGSAGTAKEDGYGLGQFRPHRQSHPTQIDLGAV